MLSDTLGRNHGFMSYDHNRVVRIEMWTGMFVNHIFASVFSLLEHRIDIHKFTDLHRQESHLGQDAVYTILKYNLITSSFCPLNFRNAVACVNK